MPRVPEPELMITEEQAYAYSWADFTALNPVMVARFRERFPEFGAGVMIDLGCGTADMTIRFAQAYSGLRVVGVDGSAVMLAYAERAIARAGVEERTELWECSLPDPTLERGEFDAVIANNLLHHVADPAAFWGAAARAGKPGAPVMVMDLRRPLNDAAADELVMRYARRALPALKEDFLNSLRAAYTAAEVEEQLRVAGLRGFQVEEIGDCQLMAWGVTQGELGNSGTGRA
jgi:ubiquinone/menaquinone biosynthesis C-methylase UbiE